MREKVQEPSGNGDARLLLEPGEQLRDQPLRLAVIGTPRSGNTWIRGLFASLYGLEELAIDRPEQLDWDQLPLRCIVQIHQYPDPAFDALIARLGFRVLTPARHPIDVMISALNYAQHTATAPQWTNASGIDRTLRGATPSSQEFLEYASINHPGSVLSFSPAWWTRPGVVQVRYEDLVAEPVRLLTNLAAQIDPKILRPLDQVVALFTIDARRSNVQVWHYHYGLGRPGIWRELVPASQAQQMADRQRKVFEVLGYGCDPDPALDEISAERNWYRLQTHLLGRHLADERHRLEQSRAELDRLRSSIESPSLARRSMRLDAEPAGAFGAWTRRVPSGVRRWWSSR